jgi:DNA repair protein RadD
MSVELPPLYPHQERAYRAVKRAWLPVDKGGKGARAICLQMPCGGGKTRTGTEVFGGALRKGRRVLWIAHREELLDQGADSLRRLGYDVGIIKADRAANPLAPIQVASALTLHKRPESLPENISIIISDECHHDKAKTREAIFGRFPNIELILGLTATPERGDKKPLGIKSGGIYQELVEGASVAELQRTPRDMRDPDGPKILVPFRVIGPSGYQKELFRAPVEGLLEFGRRKDGSFRPAIMFAASIEESRAIETEARLYGIRVAHVEGDTDDDERKRAFDMMRAGELDLITNVMIATEGTDLPNVEVVGVARGCSTEGTWIQMVMRAGRSSPATGKTEALLIDYRGHSYRHGLMETERKFSLERKAIERAETLRIRQCPTCGGVAKPSEKCGYCGHVFVVQRERQKVSRVWATNITAGNIPLANERKTVFDKLCGVANAKGYKPGWVGIQYKKRFGFWPEWKIPGRAA